jgi:large subunit ribosomal protein L6
VKALHGLSRSLVYNMVEGVSQALPSSSKSKVSVSGRSPGSNPQSKPRFLAPVQFQIPKDIKITVTDATKINIEGVDKKLVGQVAADIRSFLSAGTYKGKGVRYAGEQIRRKEGKTVQ